MLSKPIWLSIVSVVAICGLLAVSVGQSKPQVPVPSVQVPDVMSKITRPGNGAGLSPAKNGPSPQYSTGWNTVHATDCYGLYISGYYFLILYPQEGGYWYTTDPNFQHVMSQACQTNNYIAFYAYDNNLDWNQIFTFYYH